MQTPIPVLEGTAQVWIFMVGVLLPLARSGRAAAALFGLHPIVTWPVTVSSLEFLTLGASQGAHHVRIFQAS
jgi:hypothetical protein